MDAEQRGWRQRASPLTLTLGNRLLLPQTLFILLVLQLLTIRPVIWASSLPWTTPQPPSSTFPRPRSPCVLRVGARAAERVRASVRRESGGSSTPTEPADMGTFRLRWVSAVYKKLVEFPAVSSCSLDSNLFAPSQRWVHFVLHFTEIFLREIGL